MRLLWNAVLPALGFLLFSGAAYTVDVSGTWQILLNAHSGPTTLTLVLEQTGDRVEGVLQSKSIPDSSVEGSVSENTLTFSFLLSEEGRTMTVIYTGTVNEARDRMEGTLRIRRADGSERELTTWSAQRLQSGQTIPDEEAEHPCPLASLEACFQAELDRLREQAGFPGAVAAYLRPDGTTTTVATGLADQETGTPMMPSTRMLAGSVGKTFVSALVLHLVDQGTLDLDAPIATWLGDEPWFDRLPNGPDLTLRRLLNHSGGLLDHVYLDAFGAAIQEQLSADEPDLDFAFAPREMIAFVLDTEPLFPAGQGYSYTDTGYLLVGLVIEKATGSTYYDELQRRVLEPLRLAQTSPANRRDLPGLAAGYLAPDNPFGLPPKTLDDGLMLLNPATEWTGGGLVSNPGDLVRWAQVLYEEKAFNGSYLSDLLGSVWEGRRGRTRYGLGVAISETALGVTYGHSGWFPGYRTEMRYYADHGIAVAMQVNTDVNVNMGMYMRRLAEVVLVSQ